MSWLVCTVPCGPTVACGCPLLQSHIKPIAFATYCVPTLPGLSLLQAGSLRLVTLDSVALRLGGQTSRPELEGLSG